MAPQLYISVYKEQFASPGRAKRAQLRPTSAHRRNNPQPLPDFLFPRSPQPNYKLTQTQPHPSPLVNTGRPLFPPVRHLSFRSPVTTFTDSYLKTAEGGKPHRMTFANPATEQTLPSTERLQKLQLTEAPAATGHQIHTALRNPQSRMDYQRNVHPLSAQQLRQHVGAQLGTRQQTSNPAATQHLFQRTQYRSGCYSCFHVVKPYQAGHYIIHPEFVSECFHQDY